jgi:hypothetical protein
MADSAVLVAETRTHETSSRSLDLHTQIDLALPAHGLAIVIVAVRIADGGVYRRMWGCESHAGTLSPIRQLAFAAALTAPSLRSTGLAGAGSVWQRWRTAS